MQLWMEWWAAVAPLRGACSRERSFLWLAIALAGISIRSDLMGVSSIVRTLGLASHCYDRLLDFFHSSAVDVDRLSRIWTHHAMTLFPVHRSDGRPVLLGDGIKVPKCGRKMPAVKLLHQESEGNTKPAYIMGHSIQVISMLAAAGSSFFAVPLIGRIHEGVKFTNRDKRTLPDKFAEIIMGLHVGEPFTLVADAYYACGSLALRLLQQGSHLVSRLRRTAVAYQLPPDVTGPRRRGRPRLFGDKVKLWSLFDATNQDWQSAASPIYGESNLSVRFLCMDLIWRPLRKAARFVLVDHPARGRIMLITTDLNMPAVEVIRLYGLRFKIELSFKQALRVLGVYAYHFWMRRMDKLKRGSGTQHMHHKTEDYRLAVRRKIGAYHRHIQIGLIAQGVMQYLATQHADLVWASFGSWMRTIRTGVPPSEFVTASALSNAFPEFIAERTKVTVFKKFLRQNLDVSSHAALRLAA